MEGSDRTEYVMTRPYRAPEVMLSPKQYDSPVDMWAFGCVVAEMITRQVLFNGENYYKTLEMHFELLGCPQLEWITHTDGLAWVKEKKFHEKKGKPFAELFPTASKEAQDFLSKLLIMDPNQRMEASQSLKHPYFTSIRKRETEVLVFSFASHLL
ncbi:hypothetical protein RFI_37087 [Reticulomyxa filosa]|uniref:Protein kinase domain-containing protein n=1 Tax=Reticulomyxa filosa TaxID=46433 RepID=X6LFP1_RETFI|nr:hypothetical protein RFI_37087 [Reticulomyxa filosa]|eukprot:ETO00359.1 hypothetical protein RFI_37087 [Reticulomyxa filosa]